MDEKYHHGKITEKHRIEFFENLEIIKVAAFFLILMNHQGSISACDVLLPEWEGK